MCLDLLERSEPFSKGGLSSVLIQPEMGSVTTPLPAEGVERKQRLCAFLLDLCFASANLKLARSHALIPAMHYLRV